MIPSKVNVIGMTYEVRITPAKEMELENDDILMGEVLYADNLIRINDSIHEARQEQTFIHELTHAIFFEAGYEDHDEDMVNRVGKVLHRVLRDNPSLLNPLADIRQIEINVDSLTVEDIKEIMKTSSIQPVKS